MPRSAQLIADLFELRAPFGDDEILGLRTEYQRDPTDLRCPHCHPGAMEVVDFVEPEPDRKGFAVLAEPRGLYVVLLRCMHCRRSGSMTVADEE